MNKNVRKIIKIDENKCDGCGLCIPSCEEGALQIVDGKARLVKDIYCDGLGNCLGECPQGAIALIEREAEPFDEEAVEKHLKISQRHEETSGGELPEENLVSCCSGNLERNLRMEDNEPHKNKAVEVTAPDAGRPEAELSHWPVQLHLVNAQARFLKNADLLIAADCVPFAHADFHRTFLSGRSLLIGCPKLDDVETYHKKLVEIFKQNDLNTITLVHMEVGCCFGLSKLLKSALQEAGVDTLLEEIIVGVDGSIKK
ncbi:MAG: ATP-binding protein [Bacillota bacterium]